MGNFHPHKKSHQTQYQQGFQRILNKTLLPYYYTTLNKNSKIYPQMQYRQAFQQIIKVEQNFTWEN